MFPRHVVHISFNAFTFTGTSTKTLLTSKVVYVIGDGNYRLSRTQAAEVAASAVAMVVVVPQYHSKWPATTTTTKTTTAV